MTWTKSKTLAEKVAYSDLSFDAIVEVMEEAIAYGRRLERRSALHRIKRAWDDGVFSDELSSGEVFHGVLACVRHTDPGEGGKAAEPH